MLIRHPGTVLRGLCSAIGILFPGSPHSPLIFFYNQSIGLCVLFIITSGHRVYHQHRPSYYTNQANRKLSIGNRFSKHTSSHSIISRQRNVTYEGIQKMGTIPRRSHAYSVYLIKSVPDFRNQIYLKYC